MLKKQIPFRKPTSKCTLALHLTLAVFLWTPVASTGQTNPNLEQGFKPYGSYEGSNIDSVSLSNGNLTAQIPLASYPQRGSLSLDIILLYNNKNFFVRQHCNTAGDCRGNWSYKPLIGPDLTTTHSATAGGQFVSR